MTEFVAVRRTKSVDSFSHRATILTPGDQIAHQFDCILQKGVKRILILLGLHKLHYFQ